MQMRYIITCSFLLFSVCSPAQNLLVNGSFEEENICTEYSKNCAPEGWMSSQDVSFNDYTIDPRLAFDGTHFTAVEAGHARSMMDRTYIRSQLLCKLRAGHIYTIEFYLKSKYDLLDSMGLCFTTGDFLFNEETPQTLIPSLYVINAAIIPVRNDTGWQKVLFHYKAGGSENFIAIGNFCKRRFTAKTSVTEKNVLIFIDKVSMIPEDPSERLCKGWQQTKAEIYDFNIRHSYLERYIGSKGENMRKPPVASLTSIQVVDTLLIPDVLFATSKSALTSKSFGVLNSFCEKLKQRQIDSLIVEGHTDDRGSLAFNQQLSKNRAETVAGYIGKKTNLSNRLIITRSWDSQRPRAGNGTPAGRQQNRRVEVFVYTRE
jgi:outer membrane protein OmpA-like peptidoglycan-associated protein